jgi:hypothetical protein
VLASRSKRKALAANGKEGKLHAYALEDYGLSSSDVVEEFKGYIARFKLAGDQDEFLSSGTFKWAIQHHIVMPTQQRSVLLNLHRCSVIFHLLSVQN